MCLIRFGTMEVSEQRNDLSEQTGKTMRVRAEVRLRLRVKSVNVRAARVV